MSSWKIILATLVIFSAGTLSGLLVSPIINPPEERPFPPGPPGPKPEWFVEHLKKELELTPDQSEKIMGILKASGERIKERHGPYSAMMRKEFKTVREQINGVLNAEQQKKYEEMRQRRHHRHRGWRGPRGEGRRDGSRDGRGDSQPPPPPLPPADGDQ